MKRRASGKLSAYEIAVMKGDGKLIKDAPHKFTLEQSIDSLFRLWHHLDRPDFIRRRDTSHPI